jgi:hypothetical protein
MKLSGGRRGGRHFLEHNYLSLSRASFLFLFEKAMVFVVVFILFFGFGWRERCWYSLYLLQRFTLQVL